MSENARLDGRGGQSGEQAGVGVARLRSELRRGKLREKRKVQVRGGEEVEDEDENEDEQEKDR